MGKRERQFGILFYFLIILFYLMSTSVMADKRPKIGLVLSGGGAKGLAHIGVIKVLEELNIPVDYVTGTSMGSIIGGLYATGYNAVELDSTVKNIDWANIFVDNLQLNDLSMDEKEDEGKYFVSVPIKNYGLAIPQGIINGQKLSELLVRLTAPVAEISDFSKLPRPFLCIATDIVTGKPVELRGGYLPEALRASMAIPSIMTPVKIDGHLLVDGGITNNFPVQQAKDFGADIIIGIDVGAPLYKEDELTSLFRIMEQATSFTNDEATKKARKMCDILITPDITGISSASFDIPDDIIERGELAARKQYNQLLKLSKQLKKYKTTTKIIKIPTMPDSFHISSIQIKGLKNVSRELITSKLNIKPGDIVNRKTIENAITEVFSSRYFNRVIYRLKPNENGSGTILILKVEEKTLDRFRFGLHYDTDLKSALLLNTTLRNVWINGSKLKFDARLSTNPELIFSYFYYTGKAPGFRIGTVLNYAEVNVPDYNYESEKIANADLETVGAELQLQTLLNKSIEIVLGAKLDFNFIEYITTKRNDIGIEEKYVINENSGMTNFSATFLYNSLNKTVFPTNGIYANIRAEYIPIISNDLSALVSGDESDMSLLIKNDFSRASFRYKEYFPLAQRLTVQANLRMGFTSSNRAPLSYLFFIGGLARESDSFVPFEGVHFLAIKARNFFVGGLMMQWEPFSKKYVIISGKMGRSTTDKFTDIVNISSYYGYGISFGMDSFIGPIAIVFSGGTDVQSVITYFTIGYKF